MDSDSEEEEEACRGSGGIARDVADLTVCGRSVTCLGKKRRSRARRPARAAAARAGRRGLFALSFPLRVAGATLAKVVLVRPDLVRVLVV